MVITTTKTSCVKCKKVKNTIKCSGCSQDFCFDHIVEHRNELNEQFDQCEDQFNEIKIKIEAQKIEPQNNELMKQIDIWEIESIEKIRQIANEIRYELSSYIIDFTLDLDLKMKQLTEELIQCRKENDFSDLEIQRFNEELKQLKDILNNSTDFIIEQDSTTFINKIRLTNQEDDRTILIADGMNHRIVEWRCDATTGQVVAGGNSQGNRMDQLNTPSDVIVDKKTDSVIICDSGNRRIMQWPRRNGTSGNVILSNIDCRGLAMDDQRFLYVSDYKKHVVKRYQMGKTKGTVVAGSQRQAIYGSGFFTSARRAFKIIISNPIRLLVIDKVCDFLIFLGKLCITAGIGILAFFFFTHRIAQAENYVPELNYYLIPLLLIIIGTYIIAKCFFSVYSMAVDTIMLCALEDLRMQEKNKNHQVMMSKNLRKVFRVKKND
ncbi:unnamed protein product [Rotaria sp. Silwood1]|nr:unnamed protein product [Rotaria sp. Silwood1]